MPQGLVPMGITAAMLQQRNGAQLIDLRPASPHDLPVPDAVKLVNASLPNNPRQPLIVIGDEAAVKRAAAKHRLVGYVPPFTLKRDAHIPPQWEISSAQLQMKMRQGTIRVIDVREEHEFAASHIPGSERVSMFEIASRIDAKQPVAIFCETGHRSAFLLRQLRGRGYNNVLSVHGGWLDWKAQGRPLAKASTR
jgi:rhodanese-related sulfurtransferase